MSSILKCPNPACTRTFTNQAGLTQHINAYHHRHPDSEPETGERDEDFKQTWSHPLLTARPCDRLGHYLPPHTPPPPFEPLDATSTNPWNPFQDRLAFQWADFYFSDLQASERHINTGLELWAAEVAKSDSGVPWKNADDLFATIDAIQEGDNPWFSVPFHYQGVIPPNPPKWMTETYELCTHNILAVLREQISCSSFDGHYDYVPYRQFNHLGDRVWTNLMPGEWAARQADLISADESTHGTMFVIKNFTLFTSVQEILITQPVVHMEMECCPAQFFLSLKRARKSRRLSCINDFVVNFTMRVWPSSMDL
ncbi:hypothetical protein EYR40_009739 [Pleurotus pulmonarius]|nr:hypothetical protein EYR40_009739 [Pleurotus pulmonarius]